MSIIIKINDANEIEVDELAKFINKARKGKNRRTPLSVGKIKGILNQYFRKDDIKYITASVDNTLVGFLVLYPAGDQNKEINPGNTLGGNPVINSNENLKLICHKLIEKTINWARDEGIQSLEIKIPRNIMNDEDVYDNYILTYKKLGFKKKLEYVEMVCNLNEQPEFKIIIPENFDISNISKFHERDIYSCYYNSFENGDAKFFQYQGAEERLEYFRELGYPRGLNENVSIAITHNNNIAGFSFVLPDGENNHISCMCVEPRYQGIGLGKFMLFTIMNRLKKQEIDTISLGTEVKMRAFRLYNKYGFSIISGFVEYRWEQ